MNVYNDTPGLSDALIYGLLLAEERGYPSRINYTPVTSVGGDGGGTGDVRLGGAREGETVKERKIEQHVKQRAKEGGWKKCERERERQRETRTSQKESRCKLGLSGSRLQLEDKSFPRDSCALGSGTRDIQVGLDGRRRLEEDG